MDWDFQCLFACIALPSPVLIGAIAIKLAKRLHVRGDGLFRLIPKHEGIVNRGPPPREGGRLNRGRLSSGLLELRHGPLDVSPLCLLF